MGTECIASVAVPRALAEPTYPVIAANREEGQGLGVEVRFDGPIICGDCPKDAAIP